MRDDAARRGLALHTQTYGGIVRDLDGDGRDDLVIGTHAAPLRIFLARGAGFVPLPGPDFPRVDRHGCAAADVDGSGLPDLFCTVGAERGLGVKRNELWIDPGRLGATQDGADAAGLVDPFGRGRAAVFLDVDADRDPDLAVFSDPTRQDGLPSRSRLFRNDGGRFTEMPPGSLDPRSGGGCAIAADVDGDGRRDLVTCAGIGAAEDAFLRVHRNAGGRLVPMPVPAVVRDVSVVGAAVADLGGGPEPEIAIVDGSRVRVLGRLARGGWRILLEHPVPGAEAVAAGDADGDGRRDLYVVAGRSRRDVADLLLLNRGAGIPWEPVPIPPAPAGRGEAVLVIDPESDGRDAFLVLNGQGIPGPVQLITIEPALPGSVEAIR
ncbi:MAG: FG-GAP repeat domain-containing protein [Chloroflexota bacterium]